LLEVYASHEPVEPLTAKFRRSQPSRMPTRSSCSRFAAGSTGGARIKGHKVGLTSAAMQRQLGVNQPDYGHLLDRMFLGWSMSRSPSPDSCSPRVEPEMAFVLAPPAARPRGSRWPEAIAAVDFVLPALELIDSRIRDWKIGLADTIAGQRLVRGGRRAGRQARSPPGRGRTWGWRACTLHKKR